MFSLSKQDILKHWNFALHDKDGSSHLIDILTLSYK